MVNVKNVVETFSCLYVLKTIWEEEDAPVLQRERTINEGKFQTFAKKIQKCHMEKKWKS